MFGLVTDSLRSFVVLDVIIVSWLATDERAGVVALLHGLFNVYSGLLRLILRGIHIYMICAACFEGDSQCKATVKGPLTLLL